MMALGERSEDSQKFLQVFLCGNMNICSFKTRNQMSASWWQGSPKSLVVGYVVWEPHPYKCAPIQQAHFILRISERFDMLGALEEKD